MTALEELTRRVTEDHTSVNDQNFRFELLAKKQLSPPLDEHQQFLKTGFVKNKLFYGDNLEILQRYIPSESIDLVYLDPPFNSKADYNILFKEPTGERSTAQIQAFSDFWHWDNAARESYEYLTSNSVDNKIANLAESFYRLLGKNDMTAYLFMMTRRLIELHRVLKPTGSLFLHCDSNASHYLKIVLDTIFDKKNFVNEIIWKRSGAHNMSTKGFVRNTDSILLYKKGSTFTFNEQYTKYGDAQLSRYKKDKNGRLYKGENLTFSTKTSSRQFEWRGTKPPPNRSWGADLEKLEKLWAAGRILTKKDGTPRMDGWKIYLDETKGNPVSALWDDIERIGNTSGERIGYPTQKPLALLERIIHSATKEGDWVLDPFCGCGTAVIASEKLKRHWIGIDITWLAVSIMKTRMKEMFPYAELEIEGEPKDIGAAKELTKDRYQFQWWALSLIGARPSGSKPSNPREGKKGADEGIDGWLRFRIDDKIESIVVQVKSGHVSVKEIRELRDTISRQRAAMGIFITLEEPTSEMIKEVKATDPYIAKSLNMEFPKIQILTIKELLDGVEPNIPQTASAFPQAVITKTVSGKDSSTLDDFTEE